MIKRSLVLLGLGITVSGGRHASAQIAVLSSTVEERSAAAGESYEGTIRVRNTTGIAQEIKVYQTDYGFHSDGRTEYGDPGSTPRSNARWLSVSPARFTLAPGGEGTVSFRVAVPAAPAPGPRGSFWSLVMMEPIAAGSAESAQRPAGRKREVSIQTVTRFGVQVVTHLADEGERTLAFAPPRATVAAGGAKMLEVDVSNTGDRAYRPTLRLELFTADGAPAGRVESERGLVYPGTSLRQRFDLGRIPAGSYDALVVADAGEDAVFGARYKVTF
ncbi:MAG TPA: hypothetical protein VF584_04230 [Longimicrobium sp.]|jgi:hypothetical protein